MSKAVTKKIAQIIDKTEEDQKNSPEEKYDTAESVWKKIHSLAPFVKKPIPKHEKTGQILRIGSKNETTEETARQLAEWIQGKQVLLSHTSTPKSQNCRAIVSTVRYLSRRIEVSVTCDTPLPIWEDTDVWLLPVHHDEPNTSFASLESEEEEKKKNKKPEMEQRELFASINGWKYLDGVFRRMRRKYGSKWKNVYLTELRMTPVEKGKTELLEFVKDHVALRLSNDIDEDGDVYVEVARKTICAEESTISLRLTGFRRSDVDIPLCKTSTYYLRIDADDDEMESLSSEGSILAGYSLEQNVDELCERLGELSITDACIKTWLAAPHNIPFIRLVVTSSQLKKLQHFKKLHGHHVLLRYFDNDSVMVMAVISKVMREELILTLKGFPTGGKSIFFSKTQKFRIEIDHEYERRCDKMQGSNAFLESIRRRLFSDTDIRLLNSYLKLDANGHRRKFASFGCKNTAFRMIPFGTKVLLSKCWEMTGILAKKAEFVFAVRVEDTKNRDPSQLTFEIKFSKPLVRNSPDFQLTKAFYYIDFDFTESILADPCYTLYDARCFHATYPNTARKSVPIHESLKFHVMEYHQRPQKGHIERSALQPLIEKPEKPEPAVPAEHSCPSSPESGFIDEKKTPTPEVSDSRIDPKKHRQMGSVYIARRLGHENGKPLLQLRVGFDQSGHKQKMKPWNIGSHLLLTEGNEKIKIRGEIQDTNGENVVYLVDRRVSDLDFLNNWNSKNHLLCFQES